VLRTTRSTSATDSAVAGLRASPTIRHAEVDGCQVILDLSAETYRVLDEVATAMWSVLTGAADPTRTLDALAERYDVDRGRLEADLASFSQRCVSEGLLCPPGSAPPVEPGAATSPVGGRRRTGSAGGLAALRSLLDTRRALARDGFSATYRRYASLAPGRDPSRLPAALSAFGRAENLFVAGRAPNDCLGRSLSLYRFLQSANVPAEHVIGVHRFPFHAHAWVECDGAPLLDVRSWSLRFTPLARIGATR
jgi:transglutaminase superfamily protein/coenzyme PQQ synthesis protein D (PqqD)